MPFLFGAATSAHQVEGGNDANDWWAWEKAGRVAQASEHACRQYEKFEEDSALMAQLGHNAHRFSLEWTRLEPRENVWSEDAFRHYAQLVRGLRERGMEPVLTLHHFTNPLWFVRQGGWASPRAPFLFQRYVGKVVRALGRDVRYWITLNEPMVYLYRGFIEGIWPPGKQDLKEAAWVLRHLLLAHGRAYREIHDTCRAMGTGPAQVSIAKHLIQMDPCSPSSTADGIVTAMRNWFFNRLALEALHTGFLFFPGLFCEFLPFSETLDFIGMNYYFRDFIRFGRKGPEKIFGRVCTSEHHAYQRSGGETQMGWEVYPQGLYQQLLTLKRFAKPVLICENGIATDKDDQRERFISNHLLYLLRARAEGVPVAGYFYWSLLDNFEWERGYDPLFGIVGLDAERRTRQVRNSAQVLTQLCRKYFLETDACKATYSKSRATRQHPSSRDPLPFWNSAG